MERKALILVAKEALSQLSYSPRCRTLVAYGDSGLKATAPKDLLRRGAP